MWVSVVVLMMPALAFSPARESLFFRSLFSMVLLFMENWESRAYCIFYYIGESCGRIQMKYCCCIRLIEWVCVPYLRFSLIFPGQWTVEDRLAYGAHCCHTPLCTKALTEDGFINTLYCGKRGRWSEGGDNAVFLGKWTLPAFQKIELVSRLLFVCECLCTLPSEEGVEGIFRRIDYHPDNRKWVRESTHMHTQYTWHTMTRRWLPRKNFVASPATLSTLFSLAVLV